MKQQLAVSVSDNHNLQSLAKMTQQRVTELEVELLTGKENVLVSDAALHEALRLKDIEIQRLLVVSQSQVKEATFQYDQLQKQLGMYVVRAVRYRCTRFLDMTEDNARGIHVMFKNITVILKTNS